MKVPQKEGVKTTYNVGVVEGGTSVNTIAQEASMLCEYRSNDRECLETMRVFFEKTFEAYRAMGVEVEVELVGDRPCGGDVPQEKLDALIARADSAVRELFDAEPIHGPSSTDANIPLAAGSRPSASARRWAAAAIRGRRRSISISCRTARSCRCG